MKIIFQHLKGVCKVIAFVLDPIEVPEAVTTPTAFTSWLISVLESASLLAGHIYLSKAEIEVLAETWQKINLQEVPEND